MKIIEWIRKVYEDPTSMMALAVTIALAVVLFLAFALLRMLFDFLGGKKARLRHGMYKEFLWYETYMDEWKTKDGKGKNGYKYTDEPGIYILLFFRHRVLGNRFKGYEDVYVGQSLTAHKRLFQHLTGFGNGKIYHEIKDGKKAYVKIVPCEKKDLNEYEKIFIELYGADRSFNATKGGAPKR
ncbi:MAG: GIY-YIG nuclease family protein [Erysipelotrichales bacterium]|nr:GIY-YIG nuclease family protein [Erysipelotrichales bacterium]MBQ1385763.1 GIY-YIG nuclease family protein [Erysipelotrichales bacterium]MBQ2478838.1 GIY-YIG nuclease family protein [Erysipelotrichales bacterium]MBQ4011993.1 GIY-YIG nuclease family protein [Erysipelotrichales bacterium]MBQ4375838.1 GIY-YIG nuclease family protein [Erysipelotrichales bacterium]